MTITSDYLKKIKLSAISVLLMAYWGCAGDPISVELATNHPANPGAAEAAYKAEPSPFREAPSMVAVNSGGAAATPAKKHGEDPSQKKEPMPDKAPMVPENSAGSQTAKPGHQH